MEFTLADKIACIRRELALRKNVYALRVKRGAMKMEQAEREIACMQAVLEDYEKWRPPSSTTAANEATLGTTSTAAGQRRRTSTKS